MFASAAPHTNETTFRNGYPTRLNSLIDTEGAPPNRWAITKSARKRWAMSSTWAPISTPGGGTAKVLSWKPSLVARSSRSEEHTSELQSRGHLVCRLLLEKKK